MSYDPYNDPYNPVSKGGKVDLTNTMDAEGVCEGTSEAQTWVLKWNTHGPNGGSEDTPSSMGESTN